MVSWPVEEIPCSLAQKYIKSILGISVLIRLLRNSSRIPTGRKNRQLHLSNSWTLSAKSSSSSIKPLPAAVAWQVMTFRAIGEPAVNSGRKSRWIQLVFKIQFLNQEITSGSFRLANYPLYLKGEPASAECPRIFPYNKPFA